MFNYHVRFKKKFKKTTKLSISRLILALGLASINTVWALYLNNMGLSESAIGFIASALVMISFFVAFLSTPILEKYNGVKILRISLLIHSIAYFVIFLYQDLYIFLLLSAILSIAGVFRIESFDILFRDESNSKELNENEAMMYAIVNVGWLLGPLIAGFFLLEYGIGSVFFISSIFTLLSLIIISRMNLKLPEKKRTNIDGNFVKNFLDFSKDKNLVKSYIVSSGIYVWISLIFIYVPIFIIKGGLGAEFVGIFLSVVIIPLVLIEFEIGKLSEKYGFRIFFISGFFALSILSFIMFLFDNIYLSLILLVVASIPLSFLEPLQDSFFFKHVRRKRDEEKYYPIYSTATDIGSFAGRFFVAGFLLFLPTSYAYLVISVIMAGIGIVCLRIKD